MSCTAGPSMRRPVSRHGAMPRFGSPSQAEEMHKPPTKAVCSSMMMDLRWLRETMPSPSERPGGL